MKKIVKQPVKMDCPFCKEKVNYIDYKDIKLLRRFITDRGKIKPRRVTGLCAQHQKDIATAVKRARQMALIPYSVTVVSKRGDRRRR